MVTTKWAEPRPETKSQERQKKIREIGVDADGRAAVFRKTEKKGTAVNQEEIRGIGENERSPA